MHRLLRVPRLFPVLARLSLMACVSMLSACGSSVQVSVSYDPKSEFTSHQTFAMLEPNKPIQTQDPSVNPFVLQRLRQIAYSRLRARGLESVPRAQADLLVQVFSVNRERVETYPMSYYQGYGYLYGGYRGPVVAYDVRRYEEGTVVLDLIDRARNTVIFRGSARRRVSSTPSNAEMTEIIDKILTRYPPPQGAAVEEE